MEMKLELDEEAILAEGLKQYKASQGVSDEMMAESVDSVFIECFDKDVFVHNLSFSESGFEIVYSYKHEFGEDVSQQRVIRIAPTEENYRILFVELQERLEWLLNDAVPKLRS